MPAQFTIPPDTRSVGSGNPPADMNGVVDTLTAMGAGFNVLNAAFAGGADPTGTADSTAAIQAAISALPTASAASGGVLYFPQGTYKVSSTLAIPIAGVTLLGAGMWNTIIAYHGAGDCIRMYSSIGYGSGTNTSGGGIQGIMVDGASASAGACGIHAGDIYQLKWDCGARRFQGTGSKNIWLDNQYYWCEDMYGHLFTEQGTSNLVIDNSANLTGSATGSFARTSLTVVLDAKGVGNGLVIQNGADIYGAGFSLTGNMDYSTTGTKYWAVTVAAPPSYSFTATSASPCVFTAAGMYYGNGTNVFLAGGSLPAGFTAGTSYYVVNANIAAGTFGLAVTSGGTPVNSTSTGSGTVLTFQPSTLHHSPVNINVECNANASGIQPGTINFTSSAAATGYNNITGTTGIIDFSAANAFANAGNSFGNFFHDGPVYGDSFLWRSAGLGATFYSNGALASSGQIFAVGVAVSRVTTTAAITGMVLQNAGIFGDSQTTTVVNEGTGSITFAASGTSHVATGTACAIPPNSAMTFQWDSSVNKWYPLSGAGTDTTAADIQPAGIQAAGSAGLPADAGHVHQNNADLSLYLAPSGATGETYPRMLSTGYLTLVSGQSYVSAIPLPAGLPISNLNVIIGSTGFSTVTHGWLALLDSSRVVRAVSADQTSSFGSANTPLALSVSGSAYTTTYGGLYYIVICAVAGTMGTIALGPAMLTGTTFATPLLAGTSTGSLTTPPTAGSTMGAITAVGGDRFYAYTS